MTRRRVLVPLAVLMLTGWIVAYVSIARPRAMADGVDGGLWVAISHSEGDATILYTGQLEQAAFDQLVAGEAKTYVKLRRVFWEGKDGQIEKLEKIPGYTDVAYFKPETVLRIVPVEKAFAERSLQASRTPDVSPEHSQSLARNTAR